MSLRLFIDKAREDRQCRSSLFRRIRVRTSRLPKDFFESSKSAAHTRSSSASDSIQIPQTPSFGRRDSNNQTYVRRRKLQRCLQAGKVERSFRYEQGLEEREMKAVFNSLSLAGKQSLPYSDTNILLSFKTIFFNSLSSSAALNLSLRKPLIVCSETQEKKGYRDGDSRRFNDIYNFIGMRPGKTTHIFEVGDYSVKFCGNFDGGNLRNVVQTAPFQYELESAFDSYHMPSTSKIFFHFFVHGFPPGTSFQVSFCALALLATLKEDIYKYRPFRSYDGSNYHRLEDKEVEITQGNEGRVLKLNLKATEGRQYISFALPYSYERYLNMIRDLPASDEEMYIHKEVLCYSNNLNLVYAISISSQSRVTEGEEKIGENSNTILFPEKHLQPAKKYIQKPVILISSRVHPGETPASWAVEGILHFLTSQAEEAQIIRKNFQVIVVPMLNPDGVEEGLYRLDTRGHNLNRYYLVSDNRQPSIYGMKHLVQHYHTTKRLLYYFDIHGHPSQKGSFLYGNALDQLPFQVETQLFARLMSLNCPTFEEKFCIFDRAQMNSKDKYDQYTKEGCARVFAFKMAHILHSYTIELGFHGLSDSASNLLYSAQDYYRQGRQILNSVLMTCGLKQLPRGHTLHSLRRQLATEICSRDGRFKREERNISQKKQKVNEIVENSYWKPILEQHFTEVSKVSPLHKKRLRVMKKDSFSTQLQSFFSEDIMQIVKQQINSEEKEDRTSLGDLFEETKAKIEATNITFKLHRTNFTAKSTHTTKTDFEQPSEKSPGKLAKIMARGGLKHLPSQPLGRRQKFRSLRKAGCGGVESRTSGREEEHMFGDLNIRLEGEQKNLKKNKIHSLFIEAHY